MNLLRKSEILNDFFGNEVKNGQTLNWITILVIFFFFWGIVYVMSLSFFCPIYLMVKILTKYEFSAHPLSFFFTCNFLPFLDFGVQFDFYIKKTTVSLFIYSFCLYKQLIKIGSYVHIHPYFTQLALKLHTLILKRKSVIKICLRQVVAIWIILSHLGIPVHAEILFLRFNLSFLHLSRIHSEF